MPGAETVLGDAGADAELFVTDDFEDVLLSEVTGLVTAKRLIRDFDPDIRIRQFEDDEALRKRNAAAKAAGTIDCLCSSYLTMQEPVFRLSTGRCRQS